MFSIILLVPFIATALAISLPALLGDELVGTVNLELVDYSRNDSLAPSPRPRDLMVSVFYPAKHVRRYELAPAYTPPYATFLDALVGLQPGTAATVVSQAYASAYLHPSGRKAPNIVLFSPGYGMSRVDYTAAMSNLASHGYIVIGVDHPFDTAFIDYPDGRTAVAFQDILDSPEAAAIVTDIRVADLSFILDSLSKNATLARQIPGVHGKFDVSRIGIFGHSLGGAAAASAMLADSRFICGANMDGSFWGSVAAAGLSKPFLLFNTETHNRTSDATWTSFWKNLRGWRLELTVEGSTHATFSDQATLYEELLGAGQIPDLGDYFGTVGGRTMLAIENAYLNAFFEMCFEGKKQKLLNGPSEEYPAVVFWPT
jgi:dienelactone hydrolase